jgi:hypothetical protein
MNKIEHWNLNDEIKDKPETRGWVIDNFIQEKSHYYNWSLGIKWVNEKKWFIKEWFSSKKDIRTYAILISWKAKITFPDTWEVVELSSVGDYVYFSTTYSDHITTMLEDTVMVAVRWKEL